MHHSFSEQLHHTNWDQEWCLMRWVETVCESVAPHIWHMQCTWMRSMWRSPLVSQLLRVSANARPFCPLVWSRLIQWSPVLSQECDCRSSRETWLTAICFAVSQSPPHVWYQWPSEEPRRWHVLTTAPFPLESPHLSASQLRTTRHYILCGSVHIPALQDITWCRRKRTRLRTCCPISL